MPVTVQNQGDVAVVTVDAPPVNAIGKAEREGLLAAVAQVADDDAVVGAVLTGAGKTFIAGADTREFDAPPMPPHLPDAVNAIEASAKPWVAAINGAALGGGCELALGCRQRIAGPRAMIGLPEVTLGVVPGAGGTQRLPRLIGFAAALDLISQGKAVKADTALALGIVDAIEDDPVTAAIAAARGLAGTPPDPLSERPSPELDEAALADAQAIVAKRMRGQIAPEHAIRLVQLATSTDFEDGARQERETFLELRAGPQAKALRHIFFAERAARRAPEASEGTAREIASAAVVGSGTMGAGIAYALAQAGIAVTVIEADATGIARGRANIARLYDAAVKRGLMDAEAARERQSAIAWSSDYGAAGSADLAIEAVFEDMDLKAQVFAALDAVLPAGAVLATNTSYLDVNRLAAGTGRPAEVLGLHFFSPAHIMKLLEIVRGDMTSADTLATGLALAARLGKVPVIAGVCDGFIGNRILARYREVADTILIDGALPWQIDAAMVEFGFAMGVYQTQDLSGLDISYANRQRLAPTRDPARRYVPIADKVCEMGRLGRKTGKGWYVYGEDGVGQPDPEIELLVMDEAARAGVDRHPFSHEKIRTRVLAAMINEAADILAEGIARRPVDIDLVEVFGYGFPRWRGGLMWTADQIGLPSILANLERFAEQEPAMWPISPLLRDLVAKGGTFAGMN